MEKRRYLYEALVYPSNAGMEVYFPDLDVYTQGDDLFDAAFMAQDLMELWVSDMLSCGVEPPEPVFGREAPDGGHVMLVTADCNDEVPEVSEMSVQDAADVLGVSRARVYAMVRDGVLEGRKVGGSVMIGVQSVKDRFNNPRGAGRPRKDTMAAMA